MVGWCLQYHGASITCLISSRSIIYRKFGFAKLTKLSGNCAVISQGREGGDEVGCGWYFYYNQPPLTNFTIHLFLQRRTGRDQSGGWLCAELGTNHHQSFYPVAKCNFVLQQTHGGGGGGDGGNSSQSHHWPPLPANQDWLTSYLLFLWLQQSHTAVLQHCRATHWDAPLPRTPIGPQDRPPAAQPAGWLIVLT